jgi:hypothetical protein
MEIKPPVAFLAAAHDRQFARVNELPNAPTAHSQIRRCLFCRQQPLANCCLYLCHSYATAPLFICVNAGSMNPRRIGNPKRKSYFPRRFRSRSCRFFRLASTPIIATRRRSSAVMVVMRALAALWAIRFLSAAESFSARFVPPSRPKATACGFFVLLIASQFPCKLLNRNTF